MASSSNPYEHYNQPQVEDDDLIDPDDGMLFLAPRDKLQTVQRSG
jgi:hypothetical protein